MMAASSAQLDADDVMNVLESLDYDAITKDMEEYVNIVIDNIPEGKESGTKSGDISGAAYDYTVKTYEVKGQDVYDIIKGVVDRAKGDETIKDVLLQLGLTEDDYNELIDSMDISEEPTADELEEVLLSVDVYYDGDEVMGFSTDIEEVSLDMIIVEDDNEYAIDLNMTDDNDDGFKISGAVKDDGGKANGGFDCSFTDAGDTVSLSLSINDVAPVGDLFSGSIKLEMQVYDENPAIELVSASTDDKLDLSLIVTESGKDYITVKVTGEATDASDITLPSGDIFTFNEEGMNSYLNTCDTDAFTENLKSALGDDLYNDMFADDYDYDYDVTTATTTATA